MQKVTSKQVLAWADGIIHDYLFQQIRERLSGPRTRGDQYSPHNEVGVQPKKLTQVPEIGVGNPTRDIGIDKKNFGNPPPATSYYDKDVEIHGDGRADDEVGPGQTRITPSTDHKVIELLSDNPVTINSLFAPSTTERDKGTRERTRQHLQSVYNKVPLRLKHRAYGVDNIV